MAEIFEKIISMSYEATIVLGFILAARLIMELLKVPKKYCCLLWAIPFLRMALPFTIESTFSLMPKKAVMQTVQNAVPVMPQVINAGGNVAEKQPVNGLMPVVADTVKNITLDKMGLISLLWVVGILLFVSYGVVSYMQLRAKLTCSMRLVENIYVADHIDTPFVLGIIKPYIYIPSATTKEEYRYILAHEKMHLQRKDHLYKLAAFAILGLHWFNPFAWIAYLLLCKDMEMACDEAVMMQFGDDCKKEYAKALLDWSADKRLRGVPLAFSEGSVKGRIRNVLRFKKPLIGISIIAVVGIAVLALCLLSNPAKEEKDADATIKYGAYTLVSDDEYSFAGIHIEEDYMSFSYHALSSYWPVGSYEIDGDILTLTTREEKVYRFRIDGDCLIFVAEGSEPIPQYEMEGQTDVKDGAVFQYVEPLTWPIDIEITIPMLYADMDWGADGAILDYVDESKVIFHGYFGLFVYDREKQALVGAVDLEPIGCHYTQGDEACEVFVEADGSKVYLSSLTSNMMYVYDVAAMTLVMEPYDASCLKIQEQVPRDGSELVSEDGTLGQLKFVTGVGTEREEYFIFQNLLLDKSETELEEVEEQLDSIEANYEENFAQDIMSNTWGMGVEELSRTGMTFAIYNNSDKEIQFGSDFGLFVHEDDEWVEVPAIIDDWAFTMEAYPVDANSSRTETMEWEWLYGELPDGVYLLKKTIMYKNDSDEWEHVELGVMFSFPSQDIRIHP